MDSQAVLKNQIRAAAMLFDCCSVQLAVKGEQEGQGIVLCYLMAGSTCRSCRESLPFLKFHSVSLFIL